eukprot:UN19103
MTKRVRKSMFQEPVVRGVLLLMILVIYRSVLYPSPSYFYNDIRVTDQEESINYQSKE